MKNKIIYIVLVLFFVSSCGYTPVFKQKDYPFQISKIEKIGDKEVNKSITRKLSNLSEETDKNKTIYNLEIKSDLTKLIISKDSKGDPTVFKIQIDTEIKILDENDKNKVEKKISKTINYNNKSDKFELSRYEKTLIENLSQNIGERIISILSSL